MNELITHIPETALAEELLAQRFYTDGGSPDYVSVEEIHRILQRDNGKEILQRRYPFLLPTAIWAGEAYGEQNQKRLFDWLQERSQHRVNLKFAFDEAAYSDQGLAFLQDQVGFGVDFEQIDASTRIHPSYAKKFFHWMQQASDIDFVLLVERDGSPIFGNLHRELLRREHLIEKKKAVPFPEKMPKVVAVYWGEGETEAVLAKRFNRLVTVLSGIVADPNTRMAYVEKKDLYIYPRLEGHEGYKSFINIFGGKPSLLPFVSASGHLNPYVLSDQSHSDKELPLPAGRGLHLPPV
ncbi:MAG TPA: hypothetical protein PKI93_03915 [Alphaproteobacteria bacterium]|nr:hypothetical protein [Alphaproteobacteria bacterium]HNS43950.1 hypothetical protein [Alphaproteobacteria bacterium]